MARYLALDWDHNQLHVVEANVGGGGAQFRRAAVWHVELNPGTADAEALGKSLRERLKAAGIAAAPLLVVVGRDRVIVKEVRYPAVSATEEPALVRFQAVKELTHAPDDVVLDYTAEDTPNGERLAHAVIVRKELLAAYQTICKAAGLKLAGILPRPFGSMAALRKVAGATVLTPAPEPESAVAILTVADKWAELCVARGDVLVLTRSLGTGPGLTGEVRRGLALYNSQTAEPVKTVYVAGGGEHATLRDRLQDLLGVPVHPLDPFGGAEQPDLPANNRGTFLGAAGLLYARADKRPLPVNFAAPKQPKPPADPNQRKLLLGMGLAVAVVLAVVLICWDRLARAGRELDDLYLKKMEIDKQLLIVEDDAKRIKALEEWRAGDINWLDELYDLTDRFPDPTVIRLTRLSGEPLPRNARSSRFAAKLNVAGIVTDDTRYVNDFSNGFVTDGHYNTGAKVVSRNTGPDRLLRFTQQFTLPVEVEKRAPDKYTRYLDVDPPPREQRRPPGGFEMNLGGFGGQP